MQFRTIAHRVTAAGLALVAGFPALLGSAPARAADIVGAGATFPAPLYAKWADAYKTKTGVGLNYQSIGSGGGISQIKADTVTFGASDMPLKPEDLDKAGLVQFPVIIGGVVPVINLPGVTAGAMLLDGPTLASIYLGESNCGMTPNPQAEPRIDAPRDRHCTRLSL